MTTPILVSLSWYECAMAAHVGIIRNISAIFKGNKDKHGYNGSGWEVHINGALGELAVAKALDRHWPGSVNTWKAGDVGRLQVRTRSKDGWDLIVREDDDDESIYILVVGSAPDFKVCGWIRGAEARRKEWYQEYGGREPAWFVPQDALKDMQEIPLGGGE